MYFSVLISLCDFIAGTFSLLFLARVLFSLSIGKMKEKLTSISTFTSSPCHLSHPFSFFLKLFKLTEKMRTQYSEHPQPITKM